MRAEPVQVLQRLVKSSLGGEERTWELVHDLWERESSALLFNLIETRKLCRN